jgi:hypothetical protein
VEDYLSLATFPERGNKRDDIRPNLRTKGFARRVTIAFSVDPKNNVVAIHGIFYGGQDFEPLLRDTKDDDQRVRDCMPAVRMLGRLPTLDPFPNMTK